MKTVKVYYLGFWSDFDYENNLFSDILNPCCCPKIRHPSACAHDAHHTKTAGASGPDGLLLLSFTKESDFLIIQPL